MALEVWLVKGEVDVGAAQFPELRAVQREFKCKDWRAALHLAPSMLASLSSTGVVVAMFALERVKPAPPREPPAGPVAVADTEAIMKDRP